MIERLEPFDANGVLQVVVESPRGSALKIKFDPDVGLFRVSRPLPVGFAYPSDWGFVPATKAPDGARARFGRST